MDTEKGDANERKLDNPEFQESSGSVFFHSRILSLAHWLSGNRRGGGGSGVTYSYVKGQLEQDYSVSLDEAYNASIIALEHLELILIDRKKDHLGATIEARRTDDTKITVKLESRGDENTRVAIHVGLFGDQDISRRINDEIRRALGR